MFTHYSLTKGCENPYYYGDGYCWDENNNEACFFDGGDCCLSNLLTAFCTECQCLEGSGGNITFPCSLFVGDNYCDDINNHVDCNFDGGDCCGSNINTNYCSECLCLEEGGGGSGESCNQGWISDGYCDDINNNRDCTYDGGDCCGPNVNTDWCTVCQCLEGGDG